MSQKQWLVQYIESTFAGVTLDGGIDIYAAQSMDDYGNPEEDRLSLVAERHDWRRVPQTSEARYAGPVPIPHECGSRRRYLT
jgi:hypothetical protein